MNGIKKTILYFGISLFFFNEKPPKKNDIIFITSFNNDQASSQVFQFFCMELLNLAVQPLMENKQVSIVYII